jgi:hypothetical protein
MPGSSFGFGFGFGFDQRVARSAPSFDTVGVPDPGRRWRREQYRYRRTYRRQFDTTSATDPDWSIQCQMGFALQRRRTRAFPHHGQPTSASR